MLEEIMAEKFPNLVKEKVTQVQRVPIKMNPKTPTPRPVIIKLVKGKDTGRILKAAREGQLVTYKGAHIRLPADFSTETFLAERNWHEISK